MRFIIVYYLPFLLAGFFWWLLICSVRETVREFRKIKKFSIVEKIGCGFSIILEILLGIVILSLTHFAITGWFVLTIYEIPMLRTYEVKVRQQTTQMVHVIAESEIDAKEKVLKRLKYINPVWTEEDTIVFVKQ